MNRRRKITSKPSTPAPASPTSRPRVLELVGLALILLTTFVVYRPSYKGGMLWDDDVHITPPDLQPVQGLYRIWFELNGTRQYYPLLYSAFWLEHQLWGDSVLGYHLVNVLWHTISVVLLYVILKRLKIPGAMLAAAIFALHPVMVESVAWMSEQKNTLSAVFYLGAMLVYLQFDQSRRRPFYLAALGLFVLGVLTKTVTATLPAALLVIFWWQRGRLSWKRDIVPLLPFFVLGAVAGVFTGWVERKLVGAEGADFELSILQRGLLAGRVVWFYLSKLLWPANLIFIYPRWQIDPAVWWQWLFPAATLGVLVLLWSVRQKTRAPLAAFLFFVGTLFPALGFANVFPFLYSFVADHFQYLASLGMIVLASAGVAQVLRRLPPMARDLGRLLCVLLLATLSALSWRQTHMYVDTDTLYRTTLDRNPDCWMAHNNLGVQAFTSGDQQQAIEHYQAALRIKPTDPAAHNNLGALLLARGQFSEAIAQYREAVRLLPDWFDARKNLVNALIRSNQLPQAFDEIQATLKLKPDDPAALGNLGTLLTKIGKYPEAAQYLERSLQLRPHDADTHNNLGLTLGRIGKIQQAAEHFRTAIELNGSTAAPHSNLGLLLALTGNFQESINHFEKAIELGDNNPETQNGLGDDFRKTGQLQRAIEHYHTALRLNPDYVQAYANLARTLAQMDQTNEAITAAEKGIEVGHVTAQQALAEQLEEWLTHYRVELERVRDSEHVSK